MQRVSFLSRMRLTKPPVSRRRMDTPAEAFPMLAQGEEHLWLTGVKAVFAQKQLHTDIIGVLKGEEGLAKVSGKFFARY